MPTAEQMIQQLGIELPAVASALGLYMPALAAGKMVHTSGQLPILSGQLTATGKVPDDVPLSAAQAAARQAALNGLAALRQQIGSLDKVAQIVRLNVFVNSSPGFCDQAQVANGASQLLVEIFGDSGRHTRCAIGVSELPLNAPLELDLVALVK